MKDQSKTQAQLLDELLQARERILQLETAAALRKQVEEELRQSQARLAMAQEITHIGNWDWDLESDQLFWSDELYRIHGYDPSQRNATFAMAWEPIHPDDKPLVGRLLAAARKHGAPYQIEYIIIRPDGSEHVLRGIGRAVRDQQGRVVRLYGTGQDITEQKLAQQKLAESESQFRLLIENLNAGVVVHDPDASVILCNCKAPQLFGLTMDQMLAKGKHPPVKLLREDGSSLPLDEYPGPFVKSTLEPLKNYVVGFHKPDSKDLMWILVNAHPVFDSDLELAQIVVSFIDITDTKTAEEKLKESEAKYRQLFDLAQEGIWVIDAESNTSLVNSSMAAMLGYTVEEMMGESIFSFMDQRGGEIAEQNLARGREGIRDQHDFEFLRRDRSRLYATIAISPITDDQGNYAGAIAGVMDVTEQKLAEAEREQLLTQIQDQVARMQQLIDTVPEGVLLLDANRRIILANPVAESDLLILSDSPADQTLSHLAGRPLAELLSAPPPGQWHCLTAENRVFDLLARPVQSHFEPDNWVLLLRDVTKERDLQQRVQQQERLVALGQLAAGIAHDFNNIMAVITLYASISLYAPEMPSDLRERFAIIDEQAKRASALIQQILDFSRRAVLERRPLNLVSFMEEQVQLLKRTLPENIHITLLGESNHLVVNADPARVQQVVMNLALNARDAMPAGGEFSIRLDRIRFTDNQEAPTPEMALRLEQSMTGSGESEWIRIKVQDTGTGIPPDVLPHIFEPFFTTKEPGKGTGLGLAQVFGIVKQHEGEMDVVTELGQGTSFFIYLPMLQLPELEEDTRPDLALPKGRGEVILLVEDDVRTRDVLADSLEMLNYRVLTAVNGQDALDVFEQHRELIALVLSDLVMPIMGGKSLFYALQQKENPPKVVLLTGHPMEQELQGLKAEGLQSWLLKPPSLQQLAQTLYLALG